MVVGESQILGQVKDAFEMALTHKTTGLILNKVVKKAISVAKRVRTDTKIAETAVSVSYAAVELAKKIFSDLRDKTVLLVGAGKWPSWRRVISSRAVYGTCALPPGHLSMRSHWPIGSAGRPFPLSSFVKKWRRPTSCSFQRELRIISWAPTTCSGR